MGITHPRTALVTGASRGIGNGVASVLFRTGYRVAVCYREQEELASELCTRLMDSGEGRAVAVRLDQGDPASVEAAFAQVEESLGSVDTLVNNAGIAQEKPFLDLTDGDWESMLNVNLVGVVRCVRRVLPGMLSAGFGRIVNISSIGGQWGGRNQLHYAAAKAGLINLTLSLSNVYAGQGVTTNAIAPGLVATEMSATELTSEAGRQKVAGIPAGRLGTVQEVGEAVAYLASEGAGYVTGQTLNLNGGMYAG
ncbi:MAG: NAD(P)-dependent dehydrogenase (short-subunit alcohol dehydrogenase family) [Planctomycetota bacterium]|jgi:NAD(P)-dependent dehydrogenase (short-subunit alcohol dehydrogenase family)